MKIKRTLMVCLVLALCAALSVSALSEGTLKTLLAAADNLLFETHNVSLEAKAAFTYDGQLIKTLDGKYCQAGENSLLQIRLDTPRKNGSTYTGGYTVVGNGSKAYYFDPYNNPAYNVTGTDVSDVVLEKDARNSALFDFGEYFLDLLEGTMPNAVSIASVEDGTEYGFHLAEGTTPEILNPALLLVAQMAAQKYFYISPASLTPEQSYADNHFVDPEDMEALYAIFYEKLYGKPMPGNLYQRAQGSDSDAMIKINEEVYKAINEYMEEVQKTHETGATLILKDGSLQYFANVDEYYIARGWQRVMYDDYKAAFINYYHEKTGKTITPEETQAIEYSGNTALLTAYYAMVDEMEKYYLNIAKENEGVVVITVHADGTYDLSKSSYVSIYYPSAQEILSTMTELKLISADFTVKTDAEGRLVKGVGNAVLSVVDQHKTAHTLTVEFDASAGDYGTSEVKEFAASDYNVIDAQTYWEQQSENKGAAVVLPDTIEFNGVKYDVSK